MTLSTGSILAGSSNFSYGTIVCRALAILCAFLSIGAAVSFGQSQPQGELVDVSAIEANDSMFCFSYLYKGKVETVLSRADGKKDHNKSFWSIKLLKKEISNLSQTIKKLGKPKSASGKKKLKKAKADKAALLLAKKQLGDCAAPGHSDEASSIVLFKHVSPILEKQCMLCHQPLGWSNEEGFFVESGRVIPGNLEASTLYTFLSANPEGFKPAYMPKGLAPLPEKNLLLLARWIDGLSKRGPVPTPTVSGPVGEGRTLYNSYCSSCHGLVDVSAKWGKTEAQIRAALGSGGIPQMRFLSLSDDQIQKIALALAAVRPPQLGTLSIASLGNVAEGNSGDHHTLDFEVTFSGTSPQPFSVGYVTSNGTALADSDFQFEVGTLQFQGVNGEKHQIHIPIIGDSFQESDETMFVDIGGVSNGGVRVTNSTAMGTILNDDSFVQNLPVLPAQLRMAFSFNSDYSDVLGISNAAPQGDTVITSSAKVGSGALELDEGADHLLVPGQNIQNATNFTLASWVYWTNPTSQTSRIFDFGSSTSNYIFFAPKDSSARCRFEIRSASGTFTLQCPTATVLPANRWVHLAVTFDSVADEMKIYFDGTQVATRTGVTLALSSLTFSDNKIGKSRASGSTDFAGRLDELSVWDGVLSQPQISQVMAMSQSISINSGIELRLNGQLVANGSAINLGSVAIGQTSNISLTISNAGFAGLALPGDPVVQVAGRNSSEFRIVHQPWPWQELLGNGSFTTFSLRYTPTAPGDKLATLVIPNSDLQNGSFAAAINAQATGDALPVPTPPGAGDSPLARGQYLYAINCSSCHGVIAQSQKSGVTTERLTAALNSSTGVAQMRGLTLGSAEIDLVVLALNSPAPSDSSSNKVRNSVAPVGTGPFVSSVLSSIFLPDDVLAFTADDNTIKTKISEDILGVRNDGSFISGRLMSFGGRCDRFDTVCQDEVINSSQTPGTSAIRSALIVRACDDILTVDKAVSNALAKIGRTTSSTIDAQATKDVYQLFFPGRDMPAYLADVVSNFSRGISQYSATDHWRFQLHLVCTSNDWEVL